MLLGPFLLKSLVPEAFTHLFQFPPKADTALGFIYQLGPILLMFCSGSAARRILAKENRRQTFTLIGVADVVNFSIVLSLGWRRLEIAFGCMSALELVNAAQRFQLGVGRSSPKLAARSVSTTGAEEDD